MKPRKPQGWEPKAVWLAVDVCCGHIYMLSQISKSRARLNLPRVITNHGLSDCRVRIVKFVEVPRRKAKARKAGRRK